YIFVHYAPPLPRHLALPIGSRFASVYPLFILVSVLRALSLVSRRYCGPVRRLLFARSWRKGR
ncbi:hypothetical protein K504DRAFT_441782, partial [Pleomassaria siparia CBS 279.74]